MGNQIYYADNNCSMGAKTQIENKKLNVPAPGAYNIPEKVRKDQITDQAYRSLKAQASLWAKKQK